MEKIKKQIEKQKQCEHSFKPMFVPKYGNVYELGDKYINITADFIIVECIECDKIGYMFGTFMN